MSKNEAVNCEFSIHVKSDDDLMYREPLTMDTRNATQTTIIDDLDIIIWKIFALICLKELRVDFHKCNNSLKMLRWKKIYE